jgi:transcriptional regulator with XRE-family HTH domain
MAVREVITALRERAGLSQRQLSDRLGMANTYVGRIERGERTIDVVEFLDIAHATNTPAKEAFEILLSRLINQPQHIQHG